MRMTQKIDIPELLSVRNFNINQMTCFLYDNKQNIDDLVEYSLKNDKFSWRASWVLNKYTQKSANDIQPYLQMLIDYLPLLKKPGQIRETLKIIAKFNLTEEQTCDIMEFCFDCIKNNKMQASVKSKAMEILLQIGKDYAEIKSEAIAIFNETKDYYSHGVRNSIENKITRTNFNNITKAKTTTIC